jgi:hypothetical protein
MIPWNPWMFNLAGIPAGQWWRLLANSFAQENRFAVEPLFYHRFAFHTLFSLVNTACARSEARVYGTAIAETLVIEAPVFIVGSHRSGTTHLHNLLGLDDDQLAFPNTFQAIFPFSFLTCEKTLSTLVSLLVFRQRVMDAMALNLQSPQEDEFALSLLTFCSPYLWFLFPKHYERYLPYLGFDAVSPEEIRRWQTGLVWFVKKLTLRHQRRLVLKSPYHTARIRLIREVYPDACFIHIYRDPYTVFQSFCHMMRILPWYMCLQDPRGVFAEDRLIEQYTLLYDHYFHDRPAIPGDRLHELSFEALERDPLAEIGAIYEKFGWCGFGRLVPKLRRYLDSIAGYRKNVFPEIAPLLKKRLAQAWQQNFETWRYPV